MPLLVQLLGSPRIQLDDKNVHFGRLKVTALFAYLAVEQQHHTRDKLATMFWQNYTHQGARAELRRCLSVIRKHIPARYLTIEHEYVAIKAADDLHVDVLEVERLVNQHHANLTDADAGYAFLEAAVALFKGPFLDGFSLPDSPTFDYWQLDQDRNVQSRIQFALESLAVHAKQDPHTAQQYWHQLIQLVPSHEEAYRHLMYSYHEVGKRSEALRVYQQCVHVLNHELGVLPDQATQDLYEAIKQTQRSIPPETHVIAEISASRFPRLAKPSIGRQTVIAQLQGLILGQVHSRCITLLGPGGVGKTHLALELARQLQNTKLIYFFPFESVAVDSWLQQIVTHLPFEPYASDDVQQQVLNFLHNKDFLLIFDGADHLPAIDVFIEKLLMTCPHVQVLVTSRRTLNVNANYLIEVTGMTYPQQGEAREAEAFEAYQLFIHLARQQLTDDFSPNPSEQTAILEICRLLQGLPLALELAASWIRAMRCEAILDQLKNYLSNNVTGIPVVSPAASFEAVLERSWMLLNPLEQHDLMKLAVFETPFQAETAYYVAQISHFTLTKLVNYSLIVYQRATHTYAIHNLLRSWLHRKLVQSPAVYTRLKQDFVHYFALLLMNHERALAERSTQALSLIEANLQNIQGAWDWALEVQDWDRLHAILRALTYFYLAKARYHEALHSFSALRDILTVESEIERENLDILRRLLACTAVRVGYFQYKLGEYETARQMLEPYVAYLRETKDTLELAEALNSLGLTYSVLGELDQALIALEECRQIYEHHNINHGLAHVYINLAITHYRIGKPETMRGFLLQALHHYTQLNDYLGVARTCNNLGTYARSQEDWASAQKYYERSLQIQKEFGFDTVWEVACVCVNLGYVERQQEKFGLARQHTYQAYSLFKDLGHKPRTIYALFDLAALSAANGEFIAAQRYLAEALTLSQALADPAYLSRCLLIYSQIMIQSADYRAAANILCVLNTVSDLPDWIHDERDTAVSRAKTHLSEIEWQAASNYAQNTSLQDQGLLLSTELLVI